MKKKTMKKVGMLLILFLMLLLCGKVQAITLEEPGVELNLPEGFSPIYENTVWLEKNKITKEQAIEKLQEQGVLLDQMTADGNKELSVIKINTKTTQKLFQMTTLEQEEIQQMLKKYVELQQENGYQVKGQEIVMKQEMKYIYLQTQKEQTTSQIYYTIVNGMALTFSLNNYDGQMQEGELGAIMDTVKMTRVEEKPIVEENNPYMTMLPIVLFVIAGMAYTTYCKSKWKKELEKQSDSNQIKMLNEKYCKWSMIQTLFIVTSIISILTFVVHSYQLGMSYITTENISLWNKVYLITEVVQAVVLIGILIRNVQLTFRKREDSKTKVINNFLWMVIIGVMIPVFRISFAGELYGVNQVNPDYYWQEIDSMLSYLSYAILWGTYFMLSIRMKVYYEGTTIENIVTAPRKSMIRKWKEEQDKQKEIIEFFQKQQAITKQTAMDIEEIPKEYSNSKAFWKLKEGGILHKKKKTFFVKEKAIDKRMYTTFIATTKKILPVIAVILILWVLFILL